MLSPRLASKPPGVSHLPPSPEIAGTHSHIWLDKRVIKGILYTRGARDSQAAHLCLAAVPQGLPCVRPQRAPHLSPLGHTPATSTQSLILERFFRCQYWVPQGHMQLGYPFKILLPRCCLPHGQATGRCLWVSEILTQGLLALCNPSTTVRKTAHGSSHWVDLFLLPWLWESSLVGHVMVALGSDVSHSP